MSFHDKNGRFTTADQAHIVVKGGERYKVVRQLRRMKKIVRKPPAERATEAIAKSRRELQRFALMGALSAPGFVNVHEAFEQSGDCDG